MGFLDLLKGVLGGEGPDPEGATPPSPPKAVAATAAEPAAPPPRPSAAPPPRPSAAQAAGEARVAGEVALALDEVFAAGPAAGFETTTESGADFDRAAVRELFAGVAANQAQPVKDLIFELRRGTPSKDWLDVCGPVIGTLIEAATAVGIDDAAEHMGRFASTLREVAGEPGRRIEGEARERILEQFAALSEALPESFSLGEETEQRESLIIHSLLKQVPDVGHVTFERLYGSGLTTLAALFQANVRDLEATTGIPRQICEGICERIKQHRRELEAVRRSGGTSGLRDRLREVAEKLRRWHEEYQRVAEKESSDPDLARRKRELRHERQLCAFQAEVLLAELGEVTLAEWLQKQPFDRRIRALGDFLSGKSVPEDQMSAGAA